MANNPFLVKAAGAAYSSGTTGLERSKSRSDNDSSVMINPWLRGEKASKRAGWADMINRAVDTESNDGRREFSVEGWLDN